MMALTFGALSMFPQTTSYIPQPRKLGPDVKSFGLYVFHRSKKRLTTSRLLSHAKNSFRLRCSRPFLPPIFGNKLRDGRSALPRHRIRYYRLLSTSLVRPQSPIIVAVDLIDALSIGLDFLRIDLQKSRHYQSS